MEDFNLHLTGDTHAVGAAHNLCAAFLDNSIYHQNKLGIDSHTIALRRVIDINDRSLRGSFDITPSSEVMAALALAEDLADLRKRLGRMVVAMTKKGRPVTADMLKSAGAMAVLLKEAIKPNLVQTIEETPCFVHTGPFANIAHGNSSVIADRIALKLAGYVVTESGFGADCGAEKFFDIKCRSSGLLPDAAVLVCSARAVKAQGLSNLAKQIGNVRMFGVPVVVAINRFKKDTDKQISAIIKTAGESWARDAVISTVWSRGSAGGVALAKAVVKAAAAKKRFRFLYPLDMPVKEKIRTIALKVYGAKAVSYSALASRKIRLYEKLGFGRLPVCMAKTQLSLSHDPRLKGRPSGFTLPVRDVRLSAGAGFIYPLCGHIRTMPGLPRRPVGERIDIDNEGKVVGLF
jgi:formate--tetrahydrofolate ligase